MNYNFATLVAFNAISVLGLGALLICCIIKRRKK